MGLLCHSIVLLPHIHLILYNLISTPLLSIGMHFLCCVLPDAGLVSQETFPHPGSLGKGKKMLSLGEVFMPSQQVWFKLEFLPGLQPLLHPVNIECTDSSAGGSGAPGQLVHICYELFNKKGQKWLSVYFHQGLRNNMIHSIISTHISSISLICLVNKKTRAVQWSSCCQFV